mmetsp:Transcript_14107/g.15290  ORF Transcript_14107/g.15290 Transcript_14107/m.15290 type:complete len:223 (-) Transcript_14107:791-1459(-)
MIQAIVLVTLLFSLTAILAQSSDKSINHHESCEFWASIGECSKNPNYMLNYCAPACRQVEERELNKLPQTFYEIVERDIHGNEIDFSRFKGKVVYVVNVASYCGYTEENYSIIKELQKYYDEGLEIVLAPCNSFGNQEPGSASDIYRFAEGRGYNGFILEKAEVNGNKARVLFKYLKNATGKSRIVWNFDGKFIIDRNGIPHLPGKDLEGDIQKYLNEEVEL